MNQFNAAYRHQDGTVEGFVGSGFTSDRAKASAFRAMVEKCESVGQPFDTDRVIMSAKELTADELAIVRADWRMVTA